jgi:carboxyl-terminal processing protease
MQPLLGKYANGEDFIKHYNISDDDFRGFILYSSQTLKEMDSRELLQSKDYIKNILKASAARLKWGDNAFQEVMNTNDVAYKKALEQ